MIWRTRLRQFDLARRGLLLGVLNVTPDSFSDGGAYPDAEAACQAALAMYRAGAAIIDVGGESTRPGAEPVPAEEELRRVLPVIAAIRQAGDVPVSIDTSKAEVAAAAIKAGAEIVNDVTGLRGDPAMLSLVAETGTGLVLMHMQGTPRTMQQDPVYGSVVEEVREFLRQQLERAVSCRVDQDCIVLDPGIGFGKTFEHNRQLLAGTRRLADLGRPLLIGVSRKSFLARLACSDRWEDRLWPGLAITAHCRSEGARLFRVHDVAAHHDALRMTEAILEA